MAIADQPPAAALAQARQPTWIASNWGLLLAIAALVGVLLLPTPADLPIAGHRMLAILVFAVIVWMTEAVDYAVSAIVVAALMAFLLGFSPNPANPNTLLGTSAGLTLAFSGFANTALVLVASAFFSRILFFSSGGARFLFPERKKKNKKKPRGKKKYFSPLCRARIFGSRGLLSDKLFKPGAVIGSQAVYLGWRQFCRDCSHAPIHIVSTFA